MWLQVRVPPDIAQEVAYGSVISLKNYRTGGAYLHSHWHLYPEGVGARQQQVTTYGHKDENNMWLLKPADRDASTNDTDVTIVMNGDLIRLQHVETSRNLHSHRVRAPLTQRHYQLTCYGENGTGDTNDVFRIEILGVHDRQSLKTVRSVFRLIHLTTSCAVHSHNKRLPKWGWEQLEATCNPNTKHKHTLWNIEQVLDTRLPNISFSVYAPSFLEKFLESHAVMLQGNSGLKPQEGEVTSQPWQWPINFRGQPFSGGDFRVYLLGKQRGHGDPKHISACRVRMLGGADWILLGWVLHYLPFWTMGRVLYFHHYMPALIYSCMLSGIVLDYVITSLSQSFEKESFIMYHVFCGGILSAIVYSFYLFSPLSYGMTGPLADNETSIMHGLRWLDSWQI
ncbi:Protein O-mannosyl-transferase 2 [Lamellibrachia satsuma]|nr:Protein O-mannosyl-transferase 2 [Lamellibrachia satsuma]